METSLAKGDGKGGEKALSSWEVSDGTNSSQPFCRLSQHASCRLDVRVLCLVTESC